MREIKTRTTVLGFALAALGFVLLGAALWNLFLRADSGSLSQGTDFSAIPAQVHFDAPNVELNDLSGIGHALSDYRGQVVLVNLWATWCPPCQAEMPNLQRFFELHREDGFVVIAINDGELASEVRAYVESHNLTFPVWIDPTYEATDRAFKTGSLPSSYVVDRNGTVRWMWYGAISEVNLEKYIAPLIKEQQ